MCLPCLDPNGAAGCNPSHSLFGHAWRVPALLLMAQQFVSEAQWGGSNTDREAVRISLGCARDAVDASPTGSEAPLWSRAGLPLDAGNSWNLDAISLSLCGASHEKAEKVQRGESKRQVQVVFPVNQKEEFHQLDCLCVRERDKVRVFWLCLCVWSWQIVSWQIPLLRTMELTRPNIFLWNLARDKYPKLRAAVENRWVWGLAAPRRSLGCGHLIECL